MIQLHPPLSDEHPPPQPVAAKSLMVTSILSEDLTVKFIYIVIVCISAWTVSGSLSKGDRIFSDAYDEVTPFYINIHRSLIPGIEWRVLRDTFITDRKRQKRRQLSHPRKTGDRNRRMIL